MKVNTLKEEITYERKEVKRGDIFFAELDGKGSEQEGIRPVIILQNDIGNKYSPTTIVAVGTTQIDNKAKLPTHVEVYGYGLPKKTKFMLEQIRTIDKLRLKQRVGNLDEFMMIKIDRAKEISLSNKKTEEQKVIDYKVKYIRGLDNLIELWISSGKSIEDIVEFTTERSSKIKELERFCNNLNLNYKDYYIPESINKISRKVG